MSIPGSLILIRNGEIGQCLQLLLSVLHRFDPNRSTTPQAYTSLNSKHFSLLFQICVKVSMGCCERSYCWTLSGNIACNHRRRVPRQLYLWETGIQANAYTSSIHKNWYLLTNWLKYLLAFLDAGGICWWRSLLSFCCCHILRRVLSKPLAL